jgi:SAM-dependent methyltransferase
VTGDAEYPRDVTSLTPLDRQQLRAVETPSFWHRVRFELVEQQVVAHPARRVVDVGAGSGLLADHLRVALPGVEYRYAESSPPLLDALRGRLGDDAADGGGRIDADTVVTLLDVIEHVTDDRGLLAELAARMEPGAGLVVTVPAMRWLFSSWDVDLGHHRRYSRRDVAETVRAAGFEVREVSYLFPELVAPALVRRARASGGGSAEFPTLPSWLDRLAGRIGRLSCRRRRMWPVGTSVLAVARRSATTP